jgi:hypothetical protein
MIFFMIGYIKMSLFVMHFPLEETFYLLVQNIGNDVSIIKCYISVLNCSKSHKIFELTVVGKKRKNCRMKNILNFIWILRVYQVYW